MRPWHSEIKGLTCRKCHTCGKREYYVAGLRVYMPSEVEEIRAELQTELTASRAELQRQRQLREEAEAEVRLLGSVVEVLRDGATV